MKPPRNPCSVTGLWPVAGSSILPPAPTSHEDLDAAHRMVMSDGRALRQVAPDFKRKLTKGTR